jgi:hypothetical protein
MTYNLYIIINILNKKMVKHKVKSQHDNNLNTEKIYDFYKKKYDE